MADYDLTSVNLLIVEDCHPMRRILRTIARALGITAIAEAGDGFGAVEIMQRTAFDPDIILLDNVMEPMNGIDFTRMIRSGQADVSPFVPIIMVSAYAEVNSIVSARDAGITEFLAKPVSAKLIYYRIRSVIESPRAFIRTPTFFGPDRRRRQIPLEGPERRKAPYTYAARERIDNRSD